MSRQLQAAFCNFYRPPRLGEMPGDYPPSDTVRFGPGQPSVDIAEAPPWLVPEHLKMDYELFQLRVRTLTPGCLEVVGNTRTGETRWIDRSAARFVAWPSSSASVSRSRRVEVNYQ